MTRINAALDKLLALAALVDAAIIVWWALGTRRERRYVRQAWPTTLRRGQALGDGLITPDDLREDE